MSESFARWKLRIVASVFLLIGAGGAVAYLAANRRDDDASRAPTAVYERVEGGLRYTFHATSGAESLTDAAAAPGTARELAAERPDELARLRAAMLRERGAASLDDLAAAHRRTLEELKALGYR